MKGLVHIYSGDGKGKTTAAIGLGIRACGRGLKVLMVQFLKGTPTGEMETLKRLEPDFLLHRGNELKKFTWDMNNEELASAAAEQEKLMQYAFNEAASGKWDMLILDEVMAAITTGMVKLEKVTGFIHSKPVGMELVMTGRNAPGELIELADYVSEIKAVKHPMDKGIPARKGIES